MHGSSMGGGSMRSSGPVGGAHGGFASRSFSAPTTAPMMGTHGIGRGIKSAPSRSFAPRPGIPSRQTGRVSAPVRRSPQPDSRRRVGEARGRFDRDRRFRSFSAFAPILFWGSPYLYDSGYYDDYSDYGQGAPYGDEGYQPGDQDAYAPSPRAAAPNTSGDADRYAPSDQPAPSAQDWVLVCRDGGLLFATAFTVHDGQMTYFNDEGDLRKVKLADLDLDATRRFNDERGATIPLPN